MAARTSYATGTRRLRDTEALIRYLVSNEHNSPLEMAEVVFLLRVPLFVVQQMLRHRTANVNQESHRYSLPSESWYLPRPEVVAAQSASNRQGRETTPLPREQAEEVVDLIDRACAEAFRVYRRLVEEYSVARELARTVLPTGTFTTLVWKNDLRNFLHFVRLRTDQTAQYEIRQVAGAMYELVRPHFPLVCTAWETYELGAVKLSSDEWELVKSVVPVEKLLEALEASTLPKRRKDRMRMLLRKG